jgi:hypothetical protein
MPTPEEELKTRFDSLVNYNIQKTDLHDDVVLFKLDNTDLLVMGKNDVYNKLLDLKNNKGAIFTPKTEFATVTASFGEVSGRAKWKDNDGDKDGDISYAFGFKKVGVTWLLLALWGSTD